MIDFVHHRGLDVELVAAPGSTRILAFGRPGEREVRDDVGIVEVLPAIGVLAEVAGEGSRQAVPRAGGEGIPEGQHRHTVAQGKPGSVALDGIDDVSGPGPVPAWREVTACTTRVAPRSASAMLAIPF